jgi:uncharacterized membrane protein
MARRSFDVFKDIDEDRVYALLSYLSVLCVFPLLHKKGNVFVQSHARQGLALFLCEFVVFIASVILPVLMKPFLFIFGILALWGMLNALKGKEVALPFIYSLSRKLDLPSS